MEGVKALLGADLEQVLAEEGVHSFFVDSNIRRYLSAHDNDVAIAAKHLRQTMLWRTRTRTHRTRMRFIQISATRQPAITDLVNFEEVCAETFYGACTTLLKAKDGNFIETLALGQVHPDRSLASMTGEQFDAFWMEWLESLNVQLTLRQSERDLVCAASGESELATLGSLHFLLDFGGLGALHVAAARTSCAWFLAHVARGAWSHYPQCVGSFYCASPSAVWRMWHVLLSPFGPRNTMAKVKACGAVGSAQFNAAMALILDDPTATLPELMGGQRSNRASVVLPRRVDAACASTAMASGWTSTLFVAAGECVVVDIPMIDTEHPVWRRTNQASSDDEPEVVGSVTSAASAPCVAGVPLIAADVRSRSAWATRDGVPPLRVPPTDVALTRRAIVAGAAGTTSGGNLHYEWTTQSNSGDVAVDIEFSTAFQPSVHGAGEAGAVRVACRAPVRSVSGSGSFLLRNCHRDSAPPAAGTLRLSFDNTFSWLRAKIVTLRVQGRAPAEAAARS